MLKNLLRSLYFWLWELYSCCELNDTEHINSDSDSDFESVLSHKGKCTLLLHLHTFFYRIIR